MDIDKKLLNNVVEDAIRLNTQLKDLEEYKEDFEQEEYEKMKNDTLKQLVENAKLIEKMTSGDLKVSNQADEAKMRIANTIAEFYNIKDILGTYLSKEVYYLRYNLHKIMNLFSIGRINFENYQLQLSQLLEAIGKITDLNDEEKKLNSYIKDETILSKYTKDEGINKELLESKYKINN